MSELAIQPDDAPMVPMSSKTLAHIVKHPSLLVPASVRPALVECWLCHMTLKGLESNSLAIAAPLAVWINKYGLRPDDASEILYAMQKPGAFKSLEYGNQFLASLDEKCEKAIKMRNSEAWTKRYLEEEAARKAKAKAEWDATPQEEKDALARRLEEMRSRIKVY